MRTRANINLDTDAYHFASAYASAKGIPLGAAVSELIRQAEQLPESSIHLSPRLKTSPGGYLVKAKTGKRITPAMAKEASEDEFV